MTGRSQFPRQSQNVPKGTQLNNMFEIDELVTAGGMGEVYKGHNIQTHDPVAIKIVLPEFAQDELILELFRKEARILNHLHHEAIVRYYVFSIDAALGLPFLAMEYVDGPSLAERIKEGPLDVASIATLQRHLADGLEKAHEAGVIHRDIAPDNVILPGGRVDRAKIIDFGIARSAATGGGTLLGGQFAGKYNFVSPEQLGLFDGDVTNRSDIYSLGLVLAACALGRPLDMSGSQVAVIEKRRVVPDISGIPLPLRELIEAMLQPDPKDRPQSMAEVAAWITYEEPEPDPDKTRIYTTPPGRHLSRPPTRQPSQTPIAPPPQTPAAATAAPRPATVPPPAPPAPPVESRREASLPPIPATPPQRPKPSERRRDKKASRAGPIAVAIAVAAVLLLGVGGWAYVEFFSGAWYQDEPPVAADSEPPGEVAEEPEQPPADEEAATAPEPPAGDQQAAIAPEPPAPSFTSADIQAHVAGFDGGNCFFAFPDRIGDGRAEVIGYGNQRQPFDALRDGFAQRFGFDAAIEMRAVTDDQCAVVEALDELNTRGDNSVGIDLSRGVVRSGSSLSGTISGLGDRHLGLLMLDNFGFVHNLRNYATVNKDNGTATFEINGLSTANPMEFQPQLVLSIASEEPLRALDLEQPAPASQVLPALLEEVAAKPEGLATAVGYFKFGS
jgi:serine/threonine-protein kinase